MRFGKIQTDNPDNKPKKLMLGELLVQRGFLSKKHLEAALEEQRATGQYLGQVLLRRGYVSRTDLGSVLEDQLGVQYIDISSYAIDPEIATLLPEKMVRDYLCLPVDRNNRRLYVAMADPLNLEAIQSIKLATGYDVVPLFTTEGEILQTINQFYDAKQVAYQAIEESTDRVDEDDEKTIQEMEALLEDAPIVRLVNSIISGAVSQQASDIHLEPTSGDMQVRHRIDGVLHTQMTVPRRIQNAVLSRVKLIAGMDIAERRAPQDGRITVTSKGQEIDLRVSTLLTVEGEKIVMRILDKSTVLRRLPELGLLQEQLPLMESMITKPHGMILTTGPTGSGKTTTLYAILNQLNDRSKNIITIEDPVEYKVFGLNQVQISPQAGITFANGLRAILRQDPNIILVGEIRDEETARISIQAALTGHLVLSTLHTNDAPSTVTRFLDMGIEPFLTASSITGVVAQRLVRKVCLECREPYEPTDETLRGLRIDPKTVRDYTFYRGRGCRSCNGTGYSGRTALYELMAVNQTIRELILSHAPSSKIRQAAVENGMIEMRQCGLELAKMALTNLDEVLRVVFVDTD